MDGGQGNPQPTGMSLAMAKNKRPQRQMPSGCMGIFCQLFHWRMSAKKKINLFSSGSGSGRGSGMLHSSSKRFGGPQPTTPHFYPNMSGFGGCRSTVDVLLHQNHQMKAPTLVAKLMGLDSIPTALNTQNQPKPKHKPQPPHLHSSPRIDEKPAHPRVRHLKNEPQLPKRQEMGRFDSARRGGHTGSLQLKNVLTCSSKNHYYHAKLPSPLKRTNVRSERNNSASARLTDAAATKISEPGPRVTRSKANAITNYSHFVRHDLNQQRATAGTRTTAEHKSAFHSTEHRNGKLCELRYNQSRMLVKSSSHKHGKNMLPFGKDKIQSWSKHGNWQSQRITSAVSDINDKSNLSSRVKYQSRQRMLKKIGSVEFDEEMGKSSSVSQTTPERKQWMITGNEKFKEIKDDPENGELLFSMKQLVASYKAENPFQSRSLEKARCLQPTDKGSTLGLMQSISIMLEKLGHHGTASAKKLIHIKDVILNVGLLLENEVLNKSTEVNKFSICHFFNQLDIIADAVWSGSIALPGFWKLKSRNQLIWILYDLAVEYLDSSFGNNSELELQLRMGLPLRVTVQQLILGLNSEIAKWANLRGKKENKVVEWELSHSSEILTDYETEAGKVCCELDEYLLKGLVEEIVMEVHEINLVQNYSMA